MLPCKGNFTNLLNVNGAVMSTVIKLVKKPTASSADINCNKSFHMSYEEFLFARDMRQLNFSNACKKFLPYNAKVPKLIGPTYGLHEAIYLGNLKMVKSFLKQGDPITTVVPTNEWTTLHLGVLVKNFKILELLLNYTSIGTRKGSYNVKMAKQLSIRNIVDAQDILGMTSLMMAVEQKDASMIKALLESQADIIKVKNKQNQSALQIVCKEEYFQPGIGALFFRKLYKLVPTDEELAQILLSAGLRLYQVCCFRQVRLIELMYKPPLPVQTVEPNSKWSLLVKNCNSFV